MASHLALSRFIQKEDWIMLALSRKKGETIVIGDGIRITVLEVQGNSTRLGISAPREVSVMRSELLGRIRETTAVGLPFTAALGS